MIPRKPIVICHPVWRLGLGGLERQLLHVVKKLADDRFVHVVVVRGWQGEAWVDPAQFGFNVRFVLDPSSGKDRRWALRLAAILREHRADVLHVRGFAMLLDGLVAASLRPGVAVAFSFHGFEEADAPFGRMRRRLYRSAVLRCDDRWAVSRTAADAVAARLGLPTQRFDVLANGVDVRRYEPAADVGAIRRRLGLPEDRLLVLSVGSLKPVKGHDVLLEAFRRLGDDADRATLLLVGRDYLNGGLRDWADRYLARRDVRFIGEQADVLPWYQTADVFVMPSRWEGLSNALLEAMSCGLPVIATAVGGNTEVVQHGQSGVLVEVDDPGGLASAVRRLLSDATLRRTLGQEARRSMVAAHSMERAVEQYARRYQALARVAGPACGEAVCLEAAAAADSPRTVGRVM